MATQEQIDHINNLVERYHINEDEQALADLLEEFDAFLSKQTTSLFKYYQGVHPWEHVKQEAMIIFYNLVKEYTIGGSAYFTVYIQRKLPLRLRYFFTKEIKRRDKMLCHSDEQFAEKNLLGSDDGIMDIVVENVLSEDRMDTLGTLFTLDILTEREKDMINKKFILEHSYTSIAKEYGISRSRVSKVIGNAIEKIQENVRY